MRQVPTTVVEAVGTVVASGGRRFLLFFCFVASKKKLYYDFNCMRRMKALVIAVFLLIAGSEALASDGVIPDDAWDSVDRVLQQGIQDKAFPGCTAIVGTDKVRRNKNKS